jgi:hypothetical protein
MRLLKRLEGLITINVVIVLMMYISEISNQPIWSSHPDIRTGRYPCKYRPSINI